ncbi:hypothetical protein GCM10028819_31480 [Spirosoma humi]
MKPAPIILPASSYFLCLLLVMTTAGYGKGRPASRRLDAPMVIRQTVLPEGSPLFTSLPDSASLQHLDNALTALKKEDKATTSQELKAGIAGLEASVQQKPTSFKDKVLAQVATLKALLPLIPTGALGSGTLGKAVNLAKLASGGNQLEGILSAGSLLGKASQLTSGLNTVSTALSLLGGKTKSTGQSLISSALASVSNLNKNTMTAKATEPAVKTQINSVLTMIKGAL